MKTKYKKNESGSIIVYTLIILFIVIISAVGIASVSVIDMKTSRTTDDSTSAFQISDSVAEMALRDIIINENYTIETLTDTMDLADDGNGANDSVSCGTDVYNVAVISGELEVGREYRLSLYKNEGVEEVVTLCNDPATLTKVKAVGNYSGTERIIEVSLPDFCKKSGEISYWEMNDGEVGDETTTLDSIISNHNDGSLGIDPAPTCAPGVSPCPGWVGSFTSDPSEDLALDFNDADYVEVPDAGVETLARTEAISVSLWFKADGTNPISDFDTLIMKNSDVNWNDGYGIYFKDNAVSDEIRFYVNDWGSPGNDSYASHDFDLTDTTWHHVVGTYYGNYDEVPGGVPAPGVNAVKIYLDGALVSSAPGDFIGNIPYGGSVRNLFIGAGTVAGPVPGYFFDGIIDKTRVYSCALTEDEVNELYEYELNL